MAGQITRFRNAFQSYKGPQQFEIESFCNSITFINCSTNDAAVIYINGLPLYRHQSLSIDGEINTMDTTHYRSNADHAAAHLVVIRKYQE